MPWTSTPASMSSAAITCARTPVFSYMNLPVSVTRPTYSASAISSAGSTPSARIEVPHDLGGARRVLDHVVDRAEARVVVVVVDVEDVRLLALERAHRVAVDVAAVQEDDRALVEVGGQRALQAVELEEAVLVGQRELVGGHVHDRVLAQREQDAVHGDERAEGVAVGVLVRDEHEARGVAQLVEDLLARIGLDGAHACSSMSAFQTLRAFRGVVVEEGQRRRVLEAQLAADAALQEAVRGLQPLERGAHGLGVSEHAHIDASVAQIRAGLDIRDGHKSDPRILHFMGEHVAEDLSHGLVDTTHPLHAHPIPPASSNEVRLRSTRTPSG